MLMDEAVEYAVMYATPFFLFDISKIGDNYREVANAFPDASVHYAVKANNHPVLLSTLREAGSKFEVGSWEEIALLRRVGVFPQNIIFSAPVKIPQHISRAYSLGIDTYTVDSESELEKLAKLAPGVQILVRIRVSNQGSLFPLNTKFGATPQEAVELLRQALALGLVPDGVSFHVGSQCDRADTWAEALEQAWFVWNEVSDIPLTCLNIGGGFPAAYNRPVTSIETIAKTVLRGFSFFPAGTKLLIEPGRIVAANSAVLVATVIGKAQRDDREWLYLDVGALHGLLESLQSGLKISYPVDLLRGDKNAPRRRYTLTGPTCDPDDTILEDIFLPEPQVGDLVAISSVGAYSTVYATEFSGFPHPQVYFVFSEGGDHVHRKEEALAGN
jgi:ornithine decarboxylase